MVTYLKTLTEYHYCEMNTESGTQGSINCKGNIRQSKGVTNTRTQRRTQSDIPL